jgi:hypothetical protein
VNIVISVSDKYLWCLQPFSYLFNKYFSQVIDVEIAGYTPPRFKLPSNFHFNSISQPQYPKERWVDGFSKFLSGYRKSHFILFLEDYWISRKVNLEVVNTMFTFIENNPRVMRVDLTSDRLYAGGIRDAGYYGYCDMVESPGSQYQMSLQAGIWSTELFLELLYKLPEGSHSAWDVELTGTAILNENLGIRVFGTRQHPIRYINGMNNAIEGVNLKGLCSEDIQAIKGMIPTQILDKSEIHQDTLNHL